VADCLVALNQEIAVLKAARELQAKLAGDGLPTGLSWTKSRANLRMANGTDGIDFE
jgi:hypothetical protein